MESAALVTSMYFLALKAPGQAMMPHPAAAAMATWLRPHLEAGSFIKAPCSGKVEERH
tara:strand:- start:426 stop:599 length:174 start_codon:yes stop_codon:yes gene_type:complete